MTNFQLKDTEDVQAMKGSHFQFKSEKEWRSTDKPLNSRFTLNMKTLEENLSTIPFYERQNLPKKLFSEPELNAMEKSVTKLKKKKHSEKPEKNEQNISAFNEIPKGKNHVLNSPNSSFSNSQCVKNPTDSVKCQEPAEKKADDLEDWLDSVLDD